MAALLSPADRVNTKYLGYDLVIGPRTVTVSTPDGRPIGTAYTVSGARRIVKGYRREDKA
jgi:hypothetical protein